MTQYIVSYIPYPQISPTPYIPLFYIYCIIINNTMLENNAFR